MSSKQEVLNEKMEWQWTDGVKLGVAQSILYRNAVTFAERKELVERAVAEFLARATFVYKVKMISDRQLYAVIVWFSHYQPVDGWDERMCLLRGDLETIVDIKLLLNWQ